MLRHLGGLEMVIEQRLTVGGVHVLPFLLLGHVPLHPVQVLANININLMSLILLTTSTPTFSIDEAQS